MLGALATKLGAVMNYNKFSTIHVCKQQQTVSGNNCLLLNNAGSSYKSVMFYDKSSSKQTA